MKDYSYKQQRLWQEPIIEQKYVLGLTWTLFSILCFLFSNKSTSAAISLLCCLFHQVRKWLGFVVFFTRGAVL